MQEKRLLLPNRQADLPDAVCLRLFHRSCLLPHGELLCHPLRVAALEQKIDDMSGSVPPEQFKRMQKGTCSDRSVHLYSQMLTDFDRIGDHMLNIGQELALSSLNQRQGCSFYYLEGYMKYRNIKFHYNFYTHYHKSWRLHSHQIHIAGRSVCNPRFIIAYLLHLTRSAFCPSGCG